MSLDISQLWDFNDPELSERRFRGALESASEEEEFIIWTQIARTHGLRKDFDGAREVLSTIENRLGQTSAEGQVRYWLELGRAACSTAHPPESLTDAAKEEGRRNYLKAFETAKGAGLDGLAVDALHMMTMVDTAPEDQIEWNLKALAFVEASSKPEAKKWEGSLRNNLGYALHLQGNYEEALVEFRKSLEACEGAGNSTGARYAKWMIAWTYRVMGRTAEALEIQLGLEKEWEAAGGGGIYVFQELEQLYREQGDEARAEHYAKKFKEAR